MSKTYSFTYIDLSNNAHNTETTNNWNLFWDYARNGEIEILEVWETNDNWETGYQLYGLNI